MKFFYIIVVLSILTSCTYKTPEPTDKEEYVNQVRQFSERVEAAKERIDDDLWHEFKNENDKIKGERFLRFKESLVAKEIIYIGKQCYKFQGYYTNYKGKHNLVDEALKDGGDSLKIVEKIVSYHNNGQKEELSRFLDEAISVGGKCKSYPKEILTKLAIDEVYMEKWGDSW